MTIYCCMVVLCIHGCQTEVLNKHMCYQSLWSVSVFFRILSVFMAVKQRFQTNRCGTKVDHKLWYHICLFETCLSAMNTERILKYTDTDHKFWYHICLFRILSVFMAVKQRFQTNRCGTKVHVVSTV
jgi:hypothetical protein